MAAQDLFETYRNHYAAFGASPQSLVPLVQTTAAWAQRLEIRGKADVTRLCHVTASLGHQFWHDPRFKGYVLDWRPHGVPSGRRATYMVTEAKLWLRSLWDNDTLQAFSHRLGHLLQEDRGPELDTLHYVLPGHWRMFSDDDALRLLTWLRQSTPQNLRDGGPRQLLYSASALVHGTGWLNDPQYRHLAQVLRMPISSEQLAQEVMWIYQRATA